MLVRNSTDQAPTTTLAVAAASNDNLDEPTRNQSVVYRPLDWLTAASATWTGPPFSPPLTDVVAALAAAADIDGAVDAVGAVGVVGVGGAAD